MNGRNVIELEQDLYDLLLWVASPGLELGRGRVLTVDDEGGLTTITRPPQDEPFSHNGDMSAIRASFVAKRLAQEDGEYYQHVFVVHRANTSPWDGELTLMEVSNGRLTLVVARAFAASREPRRRSSALAEASR
jgi:hypothetical protein